MRIPNQIIKSPEELKLVKGWYIDASGLDLPIVEKTKEIIEHFSFISQLREELSQLGWKHKRFTSFIASFLRSKKLIFMTSTNTEDEPSLYLEVVLKKSKVADYYLMKWVTEKHSHP